MAGEYLHSLVATDVCSGWIEAVPLLAREQALAVAGLMRIRVKKSYHPPATACDRLLTHVGVVETVKTALRTQRDQVDPVELLHRIRQGQAALAALSPGEPSEAPDRNGLDQFPASLPELWREGEARPTHRQGDPKCATGGRERPRSKTFGRASCSGYRWNPTAAPS